MAVTNNWILSNFLFLSKRRVLKMYNLVPFYIFQFNNDAGITCLLEWGGDPYQITFSPPLTGHLPFCFWLFFCLLLLLPSSHPLDLVPTKFSLHVTVQIGDATPVPIFSAP
ncbi:hypothetical protein SKDZ_15G1820 [Saccharomyces kudriavzevii ZP591]|nr:hypothetical protein SKDZ_15G1820 [Saccharomyces kudriavzevii ZP591]